MSLLLPLSTVSKRRERWGDFGVNWREMTREDPGLKANIKDAVVRVIKREKIK